MAIKNGNPACGSGKIHHGIKKAGRGRIAHGVPGSGGGVNAHAGQVPRITNSVAKAKKQLAMLKFFGPSNHIVKVKGKVFSGKPRG